MQTQSDLRKFKSITDLIFNSDNNSMGVIIMRISYITIFCILMALLTSILNGQDFSGQFLIQSEGSGITLTLQSNQQGGYSGNLNGNGMSYQINGGVQNGILSGTVGDPSDGILFQAELNNNQLTLTMVETGFDGTPDYSTAQTLIFQKQVAGASQKKEEKQEKKGDVIINNKALTKEQIVEIEQTYGIKPLPGNYWYDAKSGLYGVIGYQAYGFMLPNHNFGTMDRNASNGNTGVFVNGREIPVSEDTVWSGIVGNWIQPGSYWLDAAGNAGYEGNPMPVINLYQAAQQRAYKGGSGGDNQWNTRFSAGNYNADNSQGYVSVPGYGPVGYGF